MTDEHDPRGGGPQIVGTDSRGRGAVSQAGGISEWRPPLDSALPSVSRDLVDAAVVPEAPSDLEGVLEWARRAADDRTEVPALLDELDVAELRALTARLVQLVGLLELCPSDVEPAYFVARVGALSGDFAQDPWTVAEVDR